jgi:hypothetical protein
MQPRKHHSEITSIDEGMQIDPSDTQAQNAQSPSTETVQSDSKDKFQRLAHELKQWSGMVRIPEGIQID